MKKIVLSTFLTALIIGLSGCSTPPEPSPITPQTMADVFFEMSSKIRSSGDLAVVGIGESKSLVLATNKAKIDGRIKLDDLLKTRTNGIPKNVADHIQDLAPKELKHETTNGVFTAYALMELDMKRLNQEIKPLLDKQ